MGRRVVAIGCALLLGLLLDANLPFAQTTEVLYQGCVETTIDRNGDGVFDDPQDEIFGRQEVAVIVGPSRTAEEAFNLTVVPFVPTGQSRDPTAGDIFVYSALQRMTPPHFMSCEPTSELLRYWSLGSDLTPCQETLVPLLPDLNAIPSDFDGTGTPIGSDVCGVLADDHVETNCQINHVRSPDPNAPTLVVDLPIQEETLLYGRVDLFDGTADPNNLEKVDLIIRGTAPDGSGESPMFRSEIHAQLALAGQPPPQCP